MNKHRLLYWLTVTAAIYYPLRAGMVIYQNTLPLEDTITVVTMAFLSAVLCLRWAQKWSTPT